MITTCSYRFYTLGKAVDEHGFDSVGQQKLVHLFFGGSKTGSSEHEAYRIYVNSMDNSYACDFVALREDVICHSIPTQHYGPCMDARKKD